jgi:cytochrome oxidase assembly protein ShyY1
LFNLAPSDPFMLVPIEKPISMSASKHIGYAIQWFGLSVVLVVMTLIAFLKKNE